MNRPSALESKKFLVQTSVQLCQVYWRWTPKA